MPLCRAFSLMMDEARNLATTLAMHDFGEKAARRAVVQPVRNQNRGVWQSPRVPPCRTRLMHVVLSLSPDGGVP